MNKLFVFFLCNIGKGQGMSRKVKEGQGRSWMVFPITGLRFQVRKVWGGVGGLVACRIILSAPVPVPFLRILDLGFGTWIWDLEFGLGFGTGLGLDNNHGRSKRS